MRAFILFILVTSAVMLSSCTLSPIPTTPMSSYTITNWPKRTAVTRHAGGSVTHKTLLITTPIASPGYTSSAMIYEVIPYQLRAFANHRWVAPPANLLLPLIADHLRATHYFRAVVTPPFSGAVNYQLNTQLLVLQQEFLQPQSVVRLTIQATLTNVTTGRVMGTRVFQALVPAPDNNPYSGVLATNKAAQQIAGQIAKFVGGLTVNR